MIIINLDVMLARQKMTSGELAQRVGITQANLSILKTGKAKAIRFSTLEAICRELKCQPGDILEFRDMEPRAGESAEWLPIRRSPRNNKDDPESNRLFAEVYRKLGVDGMFECEDEPPGTQRDER